MRDCESEVASLQEELPAGELRLQGVDRMSKLLMDRTRATEIWLLLR